LTALVEQFAVRVVHYRPRYFSLSTEHPMHAGWEPHTLLAEADLVLVVDCDVPWLISQANPKAEATVVHIGPDPLFARYPMRSFRTDVALTGLVAPTLARLLERALAHAPRESKLAARRDEVGQRCIDPRSACIPRARPPRPKSRRSRCSNLRRASSASSRRAGAMACRSPILPN